MTDRSYRALLGTLLLVALYFEFQGLILALIVVMLLEGVTNLRLPLVLGRLAGNDGSGASECDDFAASQHRCRLPFDAERAWRIVVSLFLILSVFVFAEMLWFFPWFMGFAILGAGISGVCPVLISLKYAGFR
ncbi:hypothetical protein TspCOW1_10640 [Thiohalobacter sp. COW1]|uniref:Permease n=1 Tax=Thiohalobacter thiocyanaticus TaxID=585455 RepID=A0A1Z4VQP2_9GAMM|nr:MULTISPECIES: DUF2892 domain-containing protein [Thiohalobacter]BAZ93970.1 permease [Thiohalobacter thiocyanaticus]BCO30961.1 hypothetical protein TspCOW1_10640 [Thiohalobacter sp. COW1]